MFNDTKLSAYSFVEYVYYSLFFAAPLLMYPFTSELFEFNKMIFIYLCATFVVAVWVFRSVAARRIVFVRTVFDIPLLLFLGAMAVSTLFSVDVHTSFFGYYSRFNGGLLSLFTYTILFYGLIVLIPRERLRGVIERILSVSLVSGVLTLAWALPGKLGHDLSCLLFTQKFDNSCWTAQFIPDERIFSTLGQPNWMGTFMAILFFIALFRLLSTQVLRLQVAYSALAAFFFLGVLLTRSRSSLLAVIPGVLIYIVYSTVYAVVRQKGKMWFFAKTGVFVTVAILLLIFKTGEPAIDTFLSPGTYMRLVTSRGAPDATPPPQPQREAVQEATAAAGVVTTSLDIRKVVWKGAVELGKQYPLFGTGLETFGYAYYFVRPVEHNATSEWDYLYNKAHNEFLNYFATTGYTGSILYVLFIVCVLGYALYSVFRKHDEHQDAPLLGLLVLWVYSAICISNFFGFSTTVTNLFWYSLPAFLMVHGQEGATAKQRKNNASMTAWVTSAIVLLVGVTVFISYWYADTLYARADYEIKAGNYAQAVELLNSAISLKDEHVYLDKRSFAYANLALVASYQKQADLVPKLIAQSEQDNIHSIQRSSQNILYWKTRIKNAYLFYQIRFDQNDLKSGESAIKQAMLLAPTDPKVPFFAASFYALRADAEKDRAQQKRWSAESLVMAQKALKLKSDYPEALYLLSQLYKKQGRRDEARTSLLEYRDRYAPGNADIQKELDQL